MRRTKEDAEKTRQALLDAALVIFSEKGYQTARLQDIAEDAGTTRGAIYHHFQHKAGLYTALIEEASQQGNQALQEAIAAGGSVADICRRILTISMQMLSDNTRYQQIVALSLFKTGISSELAEIDERRRQSAELTIKSVASYLQQGISSGDLRSDLDNLTLARAFLAYQNGIAWLWMAGGESFSLAEEAPALAEIFITGIGAA